MIVSHFDELIICFPAGSLGQRTGWSVANLCNGEAHIRTLRCPYGEVDDRLWIREAWRVEARRLHRKGPPTYLLDYAADPGTPTLTATDHPDAARYATTRAGYRSPRYMPRWASRWEMAITALRPERLQDISEADARAEGVTPMLRAHLYGVAANDAAPLDGRLHISYRNGYATEWDRLNARRGYPWANNDWVWVIGLTLVEAT